MTHNHQEGSLTLARAIADVVATSDSLSLRDIALRLDDVERSFSQQTPEMSIEIRRRTGEWKFKLLCERDAPTSDLEELHRKVGELGFTDLESQVTIEIYFANVLARSSQKDRARQVLSDVLKKAEAEGARDLVADLHRSLNRLS